MGPMPIMNPTNKTRPAAHETNVATIRPLMLHEVTNQVVSNVAASRRRMVATQPAAGASNHARHHVSRQTQS